jgi:putative addiction module antidote
MNKPLTVRKWGGSCGVTLPRSVLDELGVDEGDQLYVVSTPNGIELTRYDPKYAEALDSARRFMRRYPNLMKKLAEG